MIVAFLLRWRSVDGKHLICFQSEEDPRLECFKFVLQNMIGKFVNCKKCKTKIVLGISILQQFLTVGHLVCLDHSFSALPAVVRPFQPEPVYRLFANHGDRSLQNRRFLRILGEQRRKRGERKARVAREGRSAKKNACTHTIVQAVPAFKY